MLGFSASVYLDASTCLVLKTRHPSERNSAHAKQCAVSRAVICGQIAAGILACPVSRDVSSIYVIGASSLLGGHDISEDEVKDELRQSMTSFLQTHDLEISGRSRPEGLVVEQCVRFSVAVWVEEDWSRIADSFIPSSVVGNSALNEPFVCIDVTVSCIASGELFIGVNAKFVRAFVLEPWFLNKNAARQFDERWVVCLPNMGRGRVVALHRRMPADSPFHSWQEMRSYWKNAYGYSLPEEEPYAYYEVRFNGMQRVFLYPFYCVLHGEPEETTVRHSESRLATAKCRFMDSLQHCNSSVAGHPLTVASLERGSASLAIASALSLPFAKRPRPSLPASKRLEKCFEKRQRVSSPQDILEGGSRRVESGGWRSDDAFKKPPRSSIADGEKKLPAGEGSDGSSPNPNSSSGRRIAVTLQ